MVNLGQQVGPLPLGAWVAVVGGGLGIALYSRRTAAATGEGETTYVNDTTGGYPGVGVGGTPAYSSVGTSTPVNPEPEIVDNEAWGRKAINDLITKYNYDSELVLSAITKYLNGDELSVSEMTLVARAIASQGAPPAPMVPRVKVSVPVVNTPVVNTPAPQPAPYIAPTPAPQPAPQPQERTYTVVRGDNLSRIAQKYYGRQDWQKIFNANRDRIANANLIYPGQILRIPY